MIRVILFTETNSSFGAKFIERLIGASDVDLQAVVVRAPGVICPYYAEDAEQCDNAELAKTHGIEVLAPKSPNDQAFISRIRELRPDYLVVANYQLKLSGDVLRTPRYDAINFHPSPLPRYAGLAPFYWMWANHEEIAGVSAIIMDDSLDGGSIIAQHLFRLTPGMTALDIRDLTFQRSWNLFDLVLPTLVDHSYYGQPQDLSQRSYFGDPAREANKIE